MRTWKQKIGKRLMKHVKETTSNSTLREVLSNLEQQRKMPGSVQCYECLRIVQKLGLTAKYAP